MKKSMLLVISIFAIIFLGLGIISMKKYYGKKVYSSNLEKSSEEALKDFDGTNEGDVPSLIITGLSLWSGGSKELAIKYFERAYELGSPAGAEKLYQVYIELGDKEKIEEWKLKGAEMGVAWIQYNLGVSNDEQGNLEEAEKWYLKSAEQNYSDAQNNLGFLYGNQGKYREAEKWFIKAIEQENDESMNNLGYMYYIERKYEKSLEIFKKGLDKFPENKKMQCNISKVYYHMEKKQEAKKWNDMSIIDGGTCSYD